MANVVKPNELEVYKATLTKMSQTVGMLTLDLALAHSQIEDLHAQLNETKTEEGK